MADIYQLSGWGYSLDNVDPMRFSVHPSFNIEIPKELMKYYKINEYSVDSLTNKYFYASHPFELNDPFECFRNLLDFENVPFDTYKRFFCTFASAIESDIKELYDTNIEKLKVYFKPQFYDFLFSRIGIISLTHNQFDMLMWTHYSNHNGFLAIFDVPILQDQFNGPFPINYVEQADNFDINVNPHLAVLYLTNIKSICWSYEKEWRLIAETINPMMLPNRSELTISNERKFYYSDYALKEIVLGFNFFHYNSIVEQQNDFHIFDFVNVTDADLRIKLLKHIINNGIAVSLIHLYDSLEFKLSKKKIMIENFGGTKFGYKIMNID